MVRVIKLNLIAKSLRKMSSIREYLWTREGAHGLDPGIRMSFLHDRAMQGWGKETHHTWPTRSFKGSPSWEVIQDACSGSVRDRSKLLKQRGWNWASREILPAESDERTAKMKLFLQRNFWKEAQAGRDNSAVLCLCGFGFLYKLISPFWWLAGGVGNNLLPLNPTLCS